MGNIGDGSSSPAIEQDPSIAQIQSAQILPPSPIFGLPATGFVASINSLSGLITIQAGTSSTGVTVTVSGDGVSTISIGVTGIGLAGTAKSNITAAPPTPGNDESEGYSQFSQWIDSSVPDLYECLDASTMSAVWVKLN